MLHLLSLLLQFTYIAKLLGCVCVPFRSRPLLLKVSCNRHTCAPPPPPPAAEALETTLLISMIKEQKYPPSPPPISSYPLHVHHTHWQETGLEKPIYYPYVSRRPWHRSLRVPTGCQSVCVCVCERFSGTRLGVVHFLH